MEMKEKWPVWVRSMVLILGVSSMSVGIACSIKSGLGVTPISSLPYAVSLISGLTVGEVTWLMNFCFVALQILILRRRYRLVQLFQIPVVVIFGGVIDMAGHLLGAEAAGNYAEAVFLGILGILFLAAGVFLEVKADLVPVPGEGLLVAVCQVVPVKFGNLKIAFDMTLVALAVILSLLFLGSIEGLREGTVAGALSVGSLVKILDKHFGKYFVRSRGLWGSGK